MAAPSPPIFRGSTQYSGVDTRHAWAGLTPSLRQDTIYRVTRAGIVWHGRCSLAIAMVRLTVTLVAPESRARSILDALRSLLLPTRLEPGCLGCVVSEEIEDETTVRYAEEWATEVDMRRRVLSDRFTSLLAVMEAATEPPQVQFHFVTVTRGLDYVAEIRHCSSEV